MKNIIIVALIYFLCAQVACAQQITRVSLQASGLTCSMCSNSINKSLKTIDFVGKVDPNIETSTFEISFKPGSNVDFDQLKKKVEDAGFFVSKFVATIQFDKLPVKTNEPVTVGDKTFQFVHTPVQELNGEKSIRVLNKGFVSAKEYRKNGLPAQGVVGRFYYVTI